MITLILDFLQGIPCFIFMVLTSYMILGYVSTGKKRIMFTAFFEFVEHILAFPLSIILTPLLGVPFPVVLSMLIFSTLAVSSKHVQLLTFFMVSMCLGLLTIIPQTLVTLNYTYGIPTYIGFLGIPTVLMYNKWKTIKVSNLE